MVSMFLVSSLRQSGRLPLTPGSLTELRSLERQRRAATAAPQGALRPGRDRPAAVSEEVPGCGETGLVSGGREGTGERGRGEDRN